MIFRYSITTISMLALASISIAMTQDQVRESLLGKISTDESDISSPLEFFEMILTDELVQKLKTQGRLVYKVSDDMAETVASIQMRLEHSPLAKDFMKLTTSPHWNPENNTLVFRITDDLLSRMKHQVFQYPIPDSLHGRVKNVKLELLEVSRQEPQDNSPRQRPMDPFGQRQDDSFRRQQDNSFGQLKVDPFGQGGNLLEQLQEGIRQRQEYRQQQGNSFGQLEVDPFGQGGNLLEQLQGIRQRQEYRQQQDNSFGQRQDSLLGPARVPAVPQQDRETAKFNSILAQLTQALKATESDSEKSDLQDEIRDLLESEYDRQLNKQNAKLVEMEQRLEKLRDQYNRQKDAKDKLVEMRMTSIVSDVEGLGWPTDRRGRDSSKWKPAIAEPFKGPVPGRWTEQAMPYRIQVGDTLKIGSAIDTSLNQDAVSVIPDGMISLPLIGQIRAAGKTIDNLQQQLNERYDEFVKDAAIYVQVVQYPQREQLRSSGIKSSRKPAETTATPQTKFWLQGMAALAKANSWEPLEKMGKIILTYKDGNEHVSLDLVANNDLLAQALEAAAGQSLYFHAKNKHRWDIKLDDEEFKLYVITRQNNNSTVSAVVMNSLPNVDLMNREIKSRLADNDADNDSVTIDFENRLVILTGDPGAVKEAVEVINELTSQSKNK